MSEFWQSVCIVLIWTWAIITVVRMDRAMARATMKAKQSKENEHE
jgi:hypothetical protein